MQPVKTKKKLSRTDKKQIEAAIARANRTDKKGKSAQDSIPYERMWPDGICRVSDSHYTKTIQFQDINYQLSQNEDKTAIFEGWCDFLNYFDTLLTTPAMDGEGKTVPNCDIELSHVTFAYNQEDVIKDVSCKIPQGSVTALVGPSGSGKSTISKLIARFWDVQQGKITVGGKDIKSMEPESLMSYMSFVFQDVTLFNDTVMNNIRLGNPNATDDQVIAAAKAAYCDEFVREMPDGYQTVLGENGSTLSGGERQRISIARALLKNAPIILLDEATASLDPENEVLVQKAIAKLVEGKTVIMIAHRLRTVVDADQILVLDNGRLVEHGTHDELMKKNGLYHKLFHIQQESLGWAV